MYRRPSAVNCFFWDNNDPSPRFVPLSLLVVLLNVLFASITLATSPDLQIPYKKTLSEAPTSKLKKTHVAFTFSLYEAAIDGSKYWEETKTINVTKFTDQITVNLGETDSLNIEAHQVPL